MKVEQVELGAGGPLIQTSGVEENLSCDAFYEQLSIRMLDDTSKKQEALLMLAMEFDLTVDITLKEQRPNTYNTCEIESVTVYSKENSS